MNKTLESHDRCGRDQRPSLPHPHTRCHANRRRTHTSRLPGIVRAWSTKYSDDKFVHTQDQMTPLCMHRSLHPNFFRNNHSAWCSSKDLDHCTCFGDRRERAGLAGAGAGALAYRLRHRSRAGASSILRLRPVALAGAAGCGAAANRSRGGVPGRVHTPDPRPS